MCMCEARRIHDILLVGMQVACALTLKAAYLRPVDSHDTSILCDSLMLTAG